MASKPNLFIIGAMKCGTTSLHNYLDAHPDIAMSENKEPGYFVEELGLRNGERWYQELFADENHCQYRGESSTHYTKLPLYSGVPERLFHFNPNARLIYIMRDPFERVISHYWHAVRDIHFGGELRPLIKAVSEQPDYLAFSDYALQLQPYIDRFGKDAVLTLTFESLIKAPQAELNRIFDWLRLPRQTIGNAAQTAHNQKPEVIQGVAGAGILNRIQYSATWDRIAHLVPVGFKDWARKIAYRKVDDDEVSRDVAKLRAIVLEKQQKQVDTLRRLLGRDFPEWSVQGTSPARQTTPAGVGAVQVDFA
ncbi:MAG TPA: sulfotransferase [Steroidobacteraceae bacterium]|jgi:hypothetical protein